MVERAVNIIANQTGFRLHMRGDSLRDRRDRPLDGVGGAGASPSVSNLSKGAGRGMATPSTVEVPAGVQNATETQQNMDVTARGDDIAAEELGTAACQPSIAASLAVATSVSSGQAEFMQGQSVPPTGPAELQTLQAFQKCAEAMVLGGGGAPKASATPLPPKAFETPTDGLIFLAYLRLPHALRCERKSGGRLAHRSAPTACTSSRRRQAGDPPRARRPTHTQAPQPPVTCSDCDCVRATRAQAAVQAAAAASAGSEGSPAAQEEAAQRTAASAELEAELTPARATVVEEQGSVRLSARRLWAAQCDCACRELVMSQWPHMARPLWPQRRRALGLSRALCTLGAEKIAGPICAVGGRVWGVPCRVLQCLAIDASVRAEYSGVRARRTRVHFRARA
jgi:hypothetical protein